MSILSFWYPFFLFALFLLSYLLPYWRMPALLAANACFYFSFGKKNFLLLCALILISYGFSLSMRRSEKKRWLLAAAILCSLLPLLIFKYSSFFLGILPGGKEMFSFSLAEPLGISFFTFKMISYLVDTWKGKLRILPDFWEYALYVSFFPAIASGPIDRPDAFFAQICRQAAPDSPGKNKFRGQIAPDSPERKTLTPERPFSCSIDSLEMGALILLYGYFLKLVLADRIGILVDYVYANYTGFSGFPLFLTSILYTLQLYFDFCGYTGIAIGSARILGIQCTENFLQPYFSRSIGEFWRRWHVSLSSWLRDYIYIPLGGNRKGRLRKYGNLLVTFLVSGLWHGAGWNFLLWGGLHGLLQIFGDLTRKGRQRLKTLLHISGTRVEAIGACCITFLLVSFAWLPFRITSLHQCGSIVREMFQLSPLSLSWIYECGISHTEVHCLMLLLPLAFLIDWLRYRGKDLRERFRKLPLVLRYLILYLLLFTVLYLGAYGRGYNASSFIYFNF